MTTSGAIGGETILLNTQIYELVPASYKVEDVSKMPPAVREGFPTYDQLSKESAVAWDSWIGGFGELSYQSYRTADRIGYAELGASQIDRFYFSTDVDTRTARQIIMGPKQNTTTGMTEAPTVGRQLTPTTNMTMLSATNVWYRNAATTFRSVLSSVTPTDVIAWGDGTNTLYLVAMGTNAYQYTTDITVASPSWTTSSLGGNSQIARFWASGVAGTGTNGGTLWKAVLPNLVFASSNPKNGGAWTTAYTVGDSATNITGMCIFDNKLLVGKPEGLFWVAADGTVQPIIDMSGAADTNNCSGMVSWGGMLFVPWVQGTYIYKGGNILNVNDANPSWREVGPSLNTSNGSTVRGKVVAMCPSPTHLYAVVKSDAANYYILAYNGDPTPGRGWHPLVNLGSSACATVAWETAQTNPMLFYGFGASAEYSIMPRSSDNPLLDSNCRFQSSGLIQMSEYESPLKGVMKCYLSLVVNIENLTAGSEFVDFAYYVDGGAGMTLGRVSASGWSTLYFPTNVSGRRIILEADLRSGGTISPRIRTMELHFQLRPARRKMWHFQAIAAGGAANSLRTNPTQMGATIVANLVAARDSVTPVNFEDRFGVSWDAFVEEMSEAETMKLPNMPEPQEVVQLSVLEFKSGVGRYYVEDPNALVGSCFAA